MKYRVERNVEAADGTQTLEVEADTADDALDKFRRRQGDIVESDVEVTHISDPSLLLLSDVYKTDDRDPALVLTGPQRHAFDRLTNAFTACEKAGLDIHGEMETLYPINARELNGRTITIGEGSSAVTNGADFITPKCFRGCSADDGLGFSE